MAVAVGTSNSICSQGTSRIASDQSRLEGDIEQIVPHGFRKKQPTDVFLWGSQAPEL